MRDKRILSGTLLIGCGWHRHSTTYSRGESKIFYDGVSWYLNGEKISDTEYPNEILINPNPSFNPNIPIEKHK